MTKYAKCAVCGYVIAIPDDKSASDYVCPNDGYILTDATEDEFNAIHAPTVPLSIPSGVTKTIPSGHHVQIITAHDNKFTVNGTLRVEGSFTFVGL